MNLRDTSKPLVGADKAPMDGSEEIIVFRYYDNAIDGNIAKTKLDAYGIPCFLTEENLSNLYPGQHLMGLRVRLHLFRQDRERAISILDEPDFTLQEEPAIVCPACKSARVVRDFPRRDAESLTVLFFGVLFPGRKVNRCLDCSCEF